MANEARLMRTLADRRKPAQERVRAAEALGTPARSADEVWSTLCEIFHDPDEDTQVRIAAAHALSRRNRALAPNQLCRYLEGDEDRLIRATAAKILCQWGSIPPVQEPALQRDLETLRKRMAPFPLVNLASSYGGDPRVVATLEQALQHDDPDIRHVAQRGLGMLGRMADVLQTLHDAAPQVRAGVTETLGYFGLKTADEVSALENALLDTDVRVQQAARTALRRLGVKPTAKPREPGQIVHADTDQPTTGQPDVGPSPYPWRPLLERWSRQWLQVRDYAVELPDQVIETGWLGYPGATAQQVRELEQRLGRTLPPSYRAFLQLTNGWRRTSSFIHQVWATAEVDYFRMRNQDWIDVLTDSASVVTPEQHARYGQDQDPLAYRGEYLRDIIQISEVGDAAVYLLNPAVVSDDGEWEAWFLATWSPGAHRYRSFRDLMQAEYASFVELEKPRG